MLKAIKLGLKMGFVHLDEAADTMVWLIERENWRDTVSGLVGTFVVFGGWSIVLAKLIIILFQHIL